MKFGAIIGAIGGLALSAWLLESYGIARIFGLLRHAGWAGVLAVIAVHLPQMLLSALGWRAIAGPAVAQPSLRAYLELRWVREAVNNLLPLAQIGGEVAVSRLLKQRGVKLAAAIAGTVADLTVETVTQILFTVLGLILLLQAVGHSLLAGYILSGLAVASLTVAGVLGALWMGLAGVIERGLMRLGRWMGWAGTAHVLGLHEALMRCYRAPGRVALSALWHMMSWLLGGIEVCLALHFLGHDVSIGAGLIIESLGQAAKTAGFAVPGALGVQEGGYILTAQALGLPPEVAIALSLMKRLRETALGVPGLMFWQHTETRAATAPADSVAGVSR